MALLKKRILLFGKLPPPLIGPALATQIILNSKLKDEFEVIHFNTSHHKDINELGRSNLKNFLFPILLYLRLVKVLLKYKPDLVYILSQQTTIAYLRDIPFFIITKLFRKKLVCHLRGGYFRNWYEKELSPLMKLIVCKTQKNIDAQIVLGENLRKLFNHIMPENKIFVVPNGGNYKIQNYIKSPDKIKILYLANYINSKGINDFIKTAIILKDKTNIEFVAYGNFMSEKSKTEIEQLIKNLKNIKINNSINKEDKFKVLAESDIFLFPTYYRNEGHPWVIIEAMSAGLPIISTNHAAIPETVINGLNGYLIEKQNPKQIAEKIQYLIINPEIKTKMGKESRRLYEESFTEERMIKRLTNVFNSVLKVKQDEK